MIFTGFVPEEELPFFYKLSHCFVIASTAELLSLATLQAMASGLPVVAVKAGALPELVQENINGFLFEPNDIKKLSQSIYTILTQENLHVSMCEKSIEGAARHDINETVDRFEELYEQQKVSKETKWQMQKV